jgi:protein-tyrosine phosphatase
MAALLLRILNVPMTMIVSDYLLSTRYLAERPTPPLKAETAEQQRREREYQEVIRLQPRYINAVFEAIDRRYGGFDRYRREALHLSDEDVARLKARLLD